MVDRVAAEPTLYDASGPEPAALHGRRCTACGYVFFPPHDYGCEACGAGPEHVVPEDLAGTGTLHATATVHLHPRLDGGETFAVGSIVLDAGPAVRAPLTCPTAEGLAPGDRVHAVLVPCGTRDGHEVVELRFEPESR